jgi:nucleotide-binding universal stress UspA family protein
MSAVLETALMLASQFGSRIEGFALQPSAEAFIAMDPASGIVFEDFDRGAKEKSRAAREVFETFMERHAVKRAEPNETGPSFSWREEARAGDSFVGSHGRVFDVIVLGRPDSGQSGPRTTTLEAALFESGRPVLVAPRSPPRRLGENVLIAWNCSTEQARTVAFALPLLERARQITILTVVGGTVPGPSGEQLADYLRLNGLRAEAQTLKPEDRSTGETILAEAKRLGCDLLIKGAYTQSRLRQMIFGGATRHILAHAALPVLMAH